MIKKLFLIAFVLLNVKVSVAQTSNIVPPIITNFRIESSTPDRVYFDSSEPITGSNTIGFVISGKTISGIMINSGQTSGHYFRVTSGFTFYNNNTIRYEGGGNLQNSNNKSLSNFILRYIINNIPEPTGTIKTYFVSLAGNDNNIGTSENLSFRTIKKAASVVSPGSTVWIKAGNYGNEKILLSKSGTLINPIKFIGYKNAPGDITNIYYNYGDGALDSTEMPLLQGVSNSGNAFAFSNKSFIIVKNIQLTKYNIGFYGNHVSNIYSENIIALDFDRAIQMVGGDSFNVTLKNCLAINGGRQNFNINGYNILLENCKSFADTSKNDPTDYYFQLSGNDNIIRNSYAKRVGNLSHYGHGMSVSGNTPNSTTYNLIEKFTSVNIVKASEARRLGSSYNVFREIVSYGEGTGSSRTGGIMIRDNASYNIFENCTINTSFNGSGINFVETTEIGNGLGHHNIIRNSIFRNNRHGIYITSSNGTSNGHHNEIINCIFDNNENQFRVAKANLTFSNSKIINSSITNTPNYKLGYPLVGWSIENSNFYNGFSPRGVNSLNVDPEFVNAANGDYHLLDTSSLIDAGKNVLEVLIDFDGNIRPQGNAHDVGAFESQTQTTGAVNVNAGQDVNICLGENTTLTAIGDGDFLWSTGETNASIIVTPDSTTTYVVTITNAGETDSDEVTVTVESQPSVNLNDDVTICSGDDIVLTATGNGDFLWNTGETTSSITVNPTTTTTYTVTASNSCSTTATDDIVVNVTSGINLDAGNDIAICSGESITLTATGNGDFLWSTGETTSSITVNPNVTTTYMVISLLGNCSSSDEVIVTVEDAPLANLGNDIIICAGENITLTVEGNGNFLWSTGETTSSITINPLSTTTYSVTANSCNTSVTDEIEVNVTPEIILDAGMDVLVCSGESVVLTAQSNGDFLWNTGETTASIIVNPSTTTTYTVTSSLGNCSLSDEVVVAIEALPSVILEDDIVICSGETVLLTAEGIGDFLWSTGETASSITVNPLVTTTYTVTSNSCNTSAIDEIVVNVTPEIILNTGMDITICSGEDVILTAESNGDFLWSTGETTASIIVSPGTTTTYTVTSSLGNCMISDDIAVIVNESPIVNLFIDNISLCLGESVELNAEGNGDFLWNTGETTPSIIVSPTSTVVYSVTVSNLCGQSASDEVLVTVNDPVVAYAGEDIVINEGYSVVLTASGGEEYLWSTGETTESIIVNPTVETIYYVEVSKNGCSDVDDIKVTVNEAVVMINNGLDITVCEGENVALEAKGGVNYLWSTGEVTSAIQATPEETTTYFVSALRDGVIQTAEITIYVNDCSGNGNNRISNLNVYPNPTEGLINVFLPDLREKVRLSLVSLNGSLIYNKEVKADNNGVFTQIDLSNMAKGVYFLRMYNKNFNETKKILVI